MIYINCKSYTNHFIAPTHRFFRRLLSYSKNMINRCLITKNLVQEKNVAYNKDRIL